MAFKLITLPNGHQSLELASCDISKLSGKIAEIFEEPKVRQYTFTSELWEFGGGKFEYSNEWDDPCLIAQDNLSNKMLQSLYAELRESRPD